MLKNKECFLFRDLYGAYLEQEVEEETTIWMEQHLADCKECREWTKVFNKSSYEDNEEQEMKDLAIGQEEDIEKQVIKKAKILLISSLVIVVILAIWMSLWIFT
jgi:predicted anti-sigma-YlaC factor YlaD